MLSKAVSSTSFWVFGMTRPGIKSRSPGPLVNTLTTTPNISLYHIYLLKLYENILKFNSLNLFQETAIGLNRDPSPLWNLLQAFLVVLLFKLVNAVVILLCYIEFWRFLIQPHPTHSNQGECKCCGPGKGH